MRKMAVMALVLAAMPLTSTVSSAQGVQVIANQSQRRVDVTIDGRPFTSYIWPTTLKKPTLFPLINADGVAVTRGFPLDPQPGERVDHPHHAGLWFNYGNVNGFDFWNNSDAIPADHRNKMGTIDQTKIVSTTSGPDRGDLVVDSIWVAGDGNKLIEQRTDYIFRRHNDARIIDQVITLKALEPVVFHDDKEGLLGMRVARWLESPTEKGGVYMDSNGRPTKVDAGDTSGATGVYLTSEGVRGDAVWSTRGRWCSLTGHTGHHTATIAIIDDPENPGYQTYWHARGYGLFAANPLGRSIFDPKQAPFNFTIDKGQSATFRYRLILYSRPVGSEELNHEADSLAAEYK